MKLVTRILVVALALSLLAGCGGAPKQEGGGTAQPQAKPIKIGMVNPLSGNAATYGQSTKNGLELAKGEINQAGGINGRPIELVFEDDAGDPKQAASATQKLVDDPEIVALQGSALSSSTLAMAPIVERAKIPHLVVSSSSPKLTGINPYFFRMAVQDDQVGGLMGELAVKVLKAKNVAIMYPNNDYGKGLSTATEAKVKELGGSVTANIPYLATDKDFQAQLTEIKAKKPDAIALCGTYTDSALITKQAREMGLTVTMIGGTGPNSPKFIEIAGKAADGFIFLGVFLPNNPDPKVQEFVTKYKAKFGIEPDQFAALAYDQMYVIAEAAKRVEGGKVTRETLTKALRQTSYQGVTGKVVFNDKGDWVRPYLYITVKDGKFVIYKQ